MQRAASPHSRVERTSSGGAQRAGLDAGNKLEHAALEFPAAAAGAAVGLGGSGRRALGGGGGGRLLSSLSSLL
jgi:hypothetical protein